MSLHRFSRCLAVAAASVAASAFAAWAQSVAPVQRANVVSFFAVSELTKDPDAQPSLQGGIAADPKAWPASFYSMHQGGACTSTLVGPRALLTAAHCVPHQGTAVVSYKSKVYSGVCEQSPHYNPRTELGQSADWALCLMNQPIPVPLFETVNSDPARVKVGDAIVLTGFGCTTSQATGGNDGVYRIGTATVTHLPSGTNDIRTTGEAALCFGDSGGGAYTGSLQAPHKRVQLSVNSRIAVEGGVLTKTSFLSSLSTPAAREFLEGWAKAKGASICGVTAGAAHCREGS